MNLQQLWQKSEVPDIGDLCFPDGRRVYFLERGCSNSYSCREEVVNDFGSDGYEIQIHEKISHPIDGSIAYRGCGSMGNVGTLAYSDRNGMIIWTMCLDFSNPFVKFRFEGDMILATTEIDYEFAVPIMHPEKIRCTSRNKWRY